MEKTFNTRIAPAVTFSTHAANHLMCFQHLLVFSACVLASTVSILYLLAEQKENLLHTQSFSFLTQGYLIR